MAGFHDASSIVMGPWDTERFSRAKWYGFGRLKLGYIVYVIVILLRGDDEVAEKYQFDGHYYFHFTQHVSKHQGLGEMV